MVIALTVHQLVADGCPHISAEINVETIPKMIDWIEKHYDTEFVQIIPPFGDSAIYFVVRYRWYHHVWAFFKFLRKKLRVLNVLAKP